MYMDPLQVNYYMYYAHWEKINLKIIYQKLFHCFEEHDVVLPISVLEELDEFKKGHDSKNYEAREFIRNLDRITEGKDFTCPLFLQVSWSNSRLETSKPYRQRCLVNPASLVGVTFPTIEMWWETVGLPLGFHLSLKKK